MPSIKLLNSHDSSIIIAEVTLTLDEISAAFIKQHGLPTSTKVLIKYTDTDNDIITASTSEELEASAAHQVSTGKSLPTFSITTTLASPTQPLEGTLEAKNLKRMAARAERQAKRKEAHHGYGGGQATRPTPVFSGGAEGGEKGMEAFTTTSSTAVPAAEGAPPAQGEQAGVAPASAGVENDHRHKMRKEGWEKKMQRKILNWVARSQKKMGGEEKGKWRRGRSHSHSSNSSSSSSASASASPSPTRRREGKREGGVHHRRHHFSADATTQAHPPHPAQKRGWKEEEGRGGGKRRIKHMLRQWLAEKMGWVAEGEAAHDGHPLHPLHPLHHHHHHHHHLHRGFHWGKGVCAAK